MTQILSDNLMPHIKEMTDASLAKLKALYRAGPHELATYMSCAAELVAIEDLLIRLKASVNKGNRAAVILHEKEKGN